MKMRWLPGITLFGTARRWAVLLSIVCFATSCAFLGDDEESEEVGQSLAPLFVDFQRHYDAPSEPYFITDHIRAVNPDESKRLPLVIESDVRRMSPEALANSEIGEHSIRLSKYGFAPEDFDVEPGDVIISGLDGESFWRIIVAIEEIDGEVVWHTEDAQIADVVLEADFYLEVPDGYSLPENFNLLDIYTKPNHQTYQQVQQQQTAAECAGQPDPCTCLTLEIDDLLANTNEDDEFLATQEFVYNNIKNYHQNWLIDRRNFERSQYEDFVTLYEGAQNNDDQDVEDVPGYDEFSQYVEGGGSYDRDELFNEALGSCEKDLNWNYQTVTSDYASDFSSGHSNSAPVPPSVVCYKEFLHERIAENARSNAGKPNASIDEVCEIIDFGGGPDEDSIQQGEEGIDNEMGKAFSETCDDDDDECEDLVLAEPSYSTNLFQDPTCVKNCDSASDPSACKSECPTFKKCAGDFCFELEKIAVSYKPKLTFSLRLRPWSGHASIRFAGPLSLELGASLSASYAYSWEASKGFSFPIPGLNYGIGPLSFGVVVYVEFGMGFSFEAEGSIRATYEKSFEVGAEAGAKYWSLKPYVKLIFDDLGDDYSIETSGGVGVQFQAWAEGGVALEVGTHKAFWVTPLRAVFAASAAIRPPSCPYDIGLFIASEWGYDLDFGLFSFANSGHIFDPIEIFRFAGGLEEFITPLQHICGNSVEPPVYDETVGICGSDDNCEEGEVCVDGNCVEDGDFRLTMTWYDRVDLNLWVVTPLGELYSVAGGDISAFTRWDCGGVCDGDHRNSYVENAVFNDPVPGVYTFYVAENTANTSTSSADRFQYDIELSHKDHRLERVRGNLDPGFDEMPVTYNYCVPAGPDGEGCP